MGFHGNSEGNESAYNVRDQVRFLGWEDPLEKGMDTHSSILAWEIPRMEEPDRLQFMELQRVGHDLVTKQQQQYYSQCEYSEVFG